MSLLATDSLPSQTSRPQTAAFELAATHRISSTFLPVGFSAMGGLCQMFNARLGLTAVAILLSLALIVSAWVYLTAIGGALRPRIAIVLALSRYPDSLLSYNKF